MFTQSTDRLRLNKLSHKNLTIMLTDYKNRDRLFEDITNTHKTNSLSGFISLIGSGRSEKKTFKVKMN